MSDKTRLEMDIEHKERLRTPISIKILIALLLIGIFVIGIYAVVLKQEILKKEEEIILMQNNVQREKAQLLGKIKKLMEERESGRE